MSLYRRKHPDQFICIPWIILGLMAIAGVCGWFIVSVLIEVFSFFAK